MTPISRQLLFAWILVSDRAHAFCPYFPSKEKSNSNVVKDSQRERALYDSLSYYSENDQTCLNNCFMNDGGNLEAHHQSSDGSTRTTFDIMSELFANDGGSDMCVFSMQELRLPSDVISGDNLLEMIYLGDSAGRRMYEFSQSNSGNVLLAACTMGRIAATEACSNAKNSVEGYDYHAAEADDDSLSGTATYYKDRFCKSAVTKSKIDHPHSITIFRLNSNDLEDAEALLEEYREGHATNMAWAYETQIGADGHMLAKVVPCDQISDKFKNPSNMYPNLANENNVCDYVESNGHQFAAEALQEWESLCSVWPLNEDGTVPKCPNASSFIFVTIGFLVAACATVILYIQAKPIKGSSVDKRHLVTEMT